MSFAIGRLAAESGLSASAIRYYESEGLMERPRRVSRRRVYAQDDIERGKLLALARRLGFSIAELKALYRDGEADDRHVWTAALSLKMAQVDQQILDLQQIRNMAAAAVDCACKAPSACAMLSRGARV